METKKSTQMNRKKKTNLLSWVFGCFGVSVLVFSIALNGFLALFLLFLSAESSAEAAQTYYDERVVRAGDGADKIAVVHLSGVILHESPSDSFFSVPEPGVESVIRQLEQAGADPAVKAVIFDVDSPGGSVSASDVLYQAVRNFQQTTSKPVISYYGETSASGAYYGTASSDYIIAEPTGIVGSIGVILGGYDVTELMENIGVKELVFKSGEHKDILSPTREQTDEDKEIVNGLIQEMKQRFVDIVLTNRDVPVSQYDIAFDGRIFTASQAQNLNLVDSVGYFSDAELKASELVGISDYSLIEYSEPIGFAALFGAISHFGSDFDFEQIFSTVQGNHPQMMYLWK